MTAAPLPRRVLVSHAAPAAFDPITRPILARLGYAILDADQFEREADEDERPDLYVVDERSLGAVADDGGPPIPIVALTGSHGVTGADPRIVGALRRPAGLHEFYRLLQLVLEDTPRSSPRVATHLAAECRRGEEHWKATVLSISENGCLMRSPLPLLLGASFDMRFVLPRSGELELQAEVAYQLLPDVGLVFNAAPPSAREALAAHVARALGAL
jgi:hypothetical protein